MIQDHRDELILLLGEAAPLLSPQAKVSLVDDFVENVQVYVDVRYETIIEDIEKILKSDIPSIQKVTSIHQLLNKELNV